MRTKYFFGGILILLGILGASNNIENCNFNEAIQECKRTLAPYYYDVTEITEITFSDAEYTKQLVAPIFPGENYRLVFNVKNLPQNIGIEIYDNKPDVRKRKLLFSNENQKDKKQIIFEPENNISKLYITYKIPAINNGSINGCVVLVLGFKIS